MRALPMLRLQSLIMMILLDLQRAKVKQTVGILFKILLGTVMKKSQLGLYKVI